MANPASLLLVTSVTSVTSVASITTITLASLALPSIALALDSPTASSVSSISVPPFSTQSVGSVISGWSFQPIRNAPNATQYSLVRDDEAGVTVLNAAANAAAGALAYRFDADARVHSILRFKWRPANLITSSDPRNKAGDDYVARVYVTFASDPERASLKEKAENAIARTIYGETPPHAALSYVFTHKAVVGSIITSPYTQRVKKIVVDADPTAMGKWKSFTRDIYDDYKRAFGEEPTRISGIAVMVDTDNTGESASARFGDVSLTSRP